MKNVQLLIATMGQRESDYSLLDKMRVQSDAIVCNQADGCAFEDFAWRGHQIRWLTLNEKGVGLNRNNALMRATGEYIVFCDDDMEMADGYAQKIAQGFRDHPKADVLIFNIGDNPVNTRLRRVNRLNFLRYGAARIAARREKIIENGIAFNLCFGGGTKHMHGEDSIFLSDCLRKGLRVYTCPVQTARLLDDRPSTWRRDDMPRYLADQGLLYRQISRRWWRLLCLQDALRHAKRYACGRVAAYRRMTSAARRA